MRALSLSLLPLALLLPGGAAADLCELNWPGETIRNAVQTGDAWMNDYICSEPDEGDAIFDFIEEQMGLDGITLTWNTILSKGRRCNPEGWGGRFIDGAFAVEFVGLNRDQGTFDHVFSPYYTDADGDRVTLWLSQFVEEYTAWDGWEFECLSSNDSRGDTSWVYASNPAGDFAINLYHPWFWHQTTFERAATIVHEATHELEGHIDDDLCTNGGSCDTRYGDVNAQTLDTIFRAEAIDAYQRQRVSRQLVVTNFGMDVCGYLPLLTDIERFALAGSITTDLPRKFRFPPPLSQYPASANIIPAPDPTYDVAQPGGVLGTAYQIDVLNSTRWPCGKVCAETDFDFPAGSRACNEDFHPFENSAINGRNREKCERLNGQIAVGVTPDDRARLLEEATQMEPCAYGASDDYLDATCDAVQAAADHVDEIALAWPDPPYPVRGYHPEGAIARCQNQYCAQPDVADRDAARDACYEYDDPSGCMARQCGDLALIEEAHGRASDRYFSAVLCRASRLGRPLPQPEADGCDAAYEQCMIRDRYLQRWLEQLDGDDCWADTLPDPGGDPLFTDHRAAAETVGLDEFTAADIDGPRVLQNSCFLEEIECESLERIVALDVGRMLREVDLGPQIEAPDIWGISPLRYDRALRGELRRIADAVEIVDDPATLRAPLQRLLAQPEARVAMAEMIGHDRFFRIGGAYRAAQYFSPNKRARYMGPDAQPDPYAPTIDGMDAENDTLARVAQRVQSDDWSEARQNVAGLGPVPYLRHVRALMAASTAAELEAAHDALHADVINLME